MHNSDYPIRIHVVSDTLMEHELDMGTNFLNIVRIMINAEKVIIDTPKPVSEKKIREICQLCLDLNEVDNVDVTHVLNAEHRNAIGNLVDGCRPKKARKVELKVTVLL
jgi:flavorubredoxin